MNRMWNLSFGLLLSLLLASCYQGESSRSVESLTIAVLPDQDEKLLRKKYHPLVEHIEAHTGLKAKLLVPKSYDDLLNIFVGKKVDLALFGGVSYVMARRQANAQPLVMRDIDGHFKSVAIVRADSSVKNIHDLEGVSLAFGSPLSTSGHFMPRFFLQKEKIVPEEFFKKVLYSGAHDRTAEWVRDGKVEVGVSNSGIINEMFLDGRLNLDQVKVIWETPPFSDYVWALQPDINKAQRTLLRDVFLHMNQHDEDQALLRNLGANYYIPAVHEDFENLEQVVLQIERQNTIP